MSADLENRVIELERQLAKLTKINTVVMRRVEHDLDARGSAYTMSQSAILLEQQVRDRTEELERALAELVASNRELAAAREAADCASRAKSEIHRGQFDLVLMDCQMPEMDGFEATRAILRMPTGAAHVPIVALTASAVAGDAERCLDAGMNDYLAQPLEKPELLRTLRRWLPLEHLAPHAAAAPR